MDNDDPFAIMDDPFATLEQAAHRMEAEEKAFKAIKRTLVGIVMGRDAKSAFFTTTALKLQPVVDWECDTAATNGKNLKYSPDFINELPQPQITGLVIHEVMHCAMGHHARRQGRDPKRWNIACDLAINHPIRESGFKLPNGGIFPGEGRYKDLDAGLSAEEYYSQLPDEQEGEGEEQGNDPGGCGGVEDAGDQAEQRAAEAEWKMAVAQGVAASKGRGELPGGLAGLAGQVLNPEVDWKEVLREFVSGVMTAREDYSWASPNRRFIAQGLYLPGLRSPTLGHIVIHRDVSGSLWNEEAQSKFNGEINGVLGCTPCRVSIVYGDTRVRRVDEWIPSDGPLEISKYPGGGGTNHTHLWDWMAEQDEEPACVVCLTDGETSFGNDPGVPVLWALTQEASPPFGRKLQIK